MSPFAVRARSKVCREHAILSHIYFSCSLWQLTVKIISLYFEGMNRYNNMHELICKLKWLVKEKAGTFLVGIKIKIKMWVEMLKAYILNKVLLRLTKAFISLL